MKNIFNPNTKSYKILFGITCVVATVTAGFFISRAGSLNPTSPPADTMVTLDDIYCKLTGCTPGTYGIDSPGSPAETMHTLQEIYDATPDYKTNPGNATPGDVCNSKYFYTSSSTTAVQGTRTACRGIAQMRAYRYYTYGGWCNINSGDIGVGTDCTTNTASYFCPSGYQGSYRYDTLCQTDGWLNVRMVCYAASNCTGSSSTGAWLGTAAINGAQGRYQ